MLLYLKAFAILYLHIAIQIKLMLLVKYRENEYKLLAWRYLDHVGEQYGQWLLGYRRLLDTINRPYETILEIVAPRACTHSPWGYQVAWPFRGCGGNWHKIRPPLPPNHFDLRSLISMPSFQKCWRTFAYCSLIFFQKSREGVYRFTKQAQLTSTSHRSSRNTSRGSSNLSVSNSIHVRLPRTQEWPSWYSSPWGKFPAACWSAESWKRNVQLKFQVN